MILSSIADRSAMQNDTPIVFIVNSDASTRAWIEATVVSVGLRATSCTTATELLTCVKPGTAACAILDVVLPDTSGLELQAALARVGVSTIFVTGERCISSCVRAVKAGAVDFLTVPCDSTELVQALRCGVREALASWAQRVRVGELRSRYEQLTAREREIFEIVSTGLTNKQIARRLDISQITVQIHRGRVMKKMAAQTFASLVRMADALQPLAFQSRAH